MIWNISSFKSDEVWALARAIVIDPFSKEKKAAFIDKLLESEPNLVRLGEKLLKDSTSKDIQQYKLGPTVTLTRRGGFISEVAGPYLEILYYAPRVFYSHPIVSVRCTDKRPITAVEGPQELYWWINDGPFTAWLSEDVFGRLQGYVAKKETSVAYPSPKSAYVALSRAMIDACRVRCGISELLLWQ